ncbi:MAG TPA: hypothetical protein VMS40_08925 [Vicinamibacterales bacterium]|nr:hypothetical protein [Vicinamibacterales bacterium]
MYRLARRTVAKARYDLKSAIERWQLAGLYSPDPSDLDPRRHLDAAIEWLKRAQDAGRDRGVSYGVRFGADFQESYPETTGYICRSFVELSRKNGDADLLRRAVEMGEWEASIQMPSGAVMGGKLNTNPTPAIFNTGMVLLGWSALVCAGATERRPIAAIRAADWLVELQEPDGNWTRGNSEFAHARATVYNVKAAWGLCELGAAIDREDYVRAATRNADFCLRHQLPNGWFSDCCLTDPSRPLLHTLAYAMEGLIGIGELTGRWDYIEAARTTADSQLRIMASDGFLPGRQDKNFGAAVDWCCLTGSAQTSIVMSRLYRLTGEPRYAEAAARLNRFLMAHHDIRNTDLRLRGGLPGSWPVWGDYGRFTILNWATKFLVDALRLQLDEGTLG